MQLEKNISDLVVDFNISAVDEKTEETAKEIKRLKKKISNKEKRIKDLEKEIEELNNKWIKTKAKDFESPIGSLEI